MVKYILSIWILSLLVCFYVIFRNLYELYQDKKIIEIINIYLLGLRNGRTSVKIKGE